MLSPEDAQRIVREALKTGYSLVRQPVSAKGPRAGAAGKAACQERRSFFPPGSGPANTKTGRRETGQERPGADCVDACGIKGLDQESPINTGLERSGPFSLTRKTGCKLHASEVGGYLDSTENGIQLQVTGRLFVSL